MLVRICSDLHAEFLNYNKIPKMLETILPPDPRDKEAILVLAGDIGTFRHYASTIKPVLKALSPRFRKIFYVYGNHCFYGGTWWTDYKNFWDDKTIPDNVYILDDTYLVVDDTAFIGSTLWTSMNDRDPLAMFHAERGMTDFEIIRYQSAPEGPYSRPGIRICAEDTVKRHEVSRDYIFQAINILKNLTLKTVVVTHHLPSFQSVNKKFEGDLLNHAFATELGDRIVECGPDLWVHGHTHDSVDHMLGETRIICNPFGYHPNVLNHKYNNSLFVEV